MLNRVKEGFMLTLQSLQYINFRAMELVITQVYNLVSEAQIFIPPLLYHLPEHLGM